MLIEFRVFFALSGVKWEWLGGGAVCLLFSRRGKGEKVIIGVYRVKYILFSIYWCVNARELKKDEIERKFFEC